jgi:uncharacterized membrane protein
MTPKASDGEKLQALRRGPGGDLWRPKPLRAWRVAMALLLPLPLNCPPPAWADFRLCNNTHVLINLAVGALTGEDFSTEGWWAVTPGSCSTPIHGRLTGRFVYLYATDIQGADVLKGTVSMCIDRSKFNVVGIDNCWRRGLQAVAFAEIDTQNSPDWTTFLTEPGR